MRKRDVYVALLLLLVPLSLAFQGVLFQTGGVEADETVTNIRIDQEGDAVFVLEIRTRLDTDDRRQAFESFETDVSQNPDSVVSDFRASVASLVERARAETGRNMSVSNFTVTTSVEPLPVERGVVRYTFDWDGFASVDGDVIRAGDVVSGYILEEGDALVFEYPEGYEVSSVDPSPDVTEDGLVRWNARDFTEDQPRVVLAPADPASSDGGDPDGSDGADKGAGRTVPLYAYAVALLVITSVVAVVYHRNKDEPDTPSPGMKGGAPAEPGTAEDEDGSPFEDLPDTERILRIVESEGGRMKQKDVVETTGWSEAKVSQVTSTLEDDGEIRKLRMGRENILELDDGDDDLPA